jgi:L-lactate dehydrogenase (cytochrome)
MPDKHLRRCISIDDLRKLAARRLPEPIYDLLSDGVEDGVTFRRNTDDFRGFSIVPRFLRDVSKIVTTVRVMSCELSFPLILAPTGTQAILHPGGEVAAARAAAKAGIMYSYSTMSTATLEEVADVGPGSRMFQLYALIDKEITNELVHRARQAKWDVLCLTIDSPGVARLETLERWGFSFVNRPPLKTTVKILQKPAWLWRQRQIKKRTDPHIVSLFRAKGHEVGADLINWAIRRDLNWDDAAALRRSWDGPFAIKGILCVEDAKKAVEIGASAIVVCNHGGLSMDGLPSSISVIEQIVDAVGHKVEVLLSSGVRRGSSILKSLALGAQATLVGRPFLYGLAAAGEDGVSHAIEILREEFKTALRMTGCASPRELTRDLIKKEAS